MTGSTHEQLLELRKTLFEQTDRLRRLVDQLLDLSRLEAGAIEVRPRPFRVRRRVEELLLMAAAERLAEVELDLEPALEVYADPDAFDRVVSNLITNAFRYGAPPIRVAAKEEAAMLRLAVEDSGEGVAPEFVPRLFERFSRDDEAASIAGGSGLGLAIAQSYAAGARRPDRLYAGRAAWGTLRARPAARGRGRPQRGVALLCEAQPYR